MVCLHICSASYVDSHGNFNLESVWQDSGSSKNGSGFDFCGRAASLVELEPFCKMLVKKLRLTISNAQKKIKCS